MSFFLVWFNENEYYGKLLGIKYANDYEITFNRKETLFYIPGIYKILTEWFTDSNINLNMDIHKKFVKLQFDMSKKINLLTYIESLKDKELTLEEFENFTAESFLIEINKCGILENTDFIHILKYNKLIRIIFNSLVGGTNYIIYNIIYNFFNILKLRQILLSLTPIERIIMIAPQISILNKFVEMIILKNGHLKNLEFYEFAAPNSFLTILNKNELYIIRRHIDKNNNHYNFGFGVKGFQCPAALFVYKIITNIIDNLKKYDIQIVGTPIYSKNKRFTKVILNKKDIIFKFKSIEYN